MSRIRSFVLPAVVGVCAFLFAVALHWPTLNRAEFSWDESAFLLMTRALLRGHLPYTNIFDHKQPLIYFILAPSQIAGPSLLSARISMLVFVALGALAVFLILRSLLNGVRFGSWLGPTLVVVGSMAVDGESVNTELISMAFAAWAVFLLLPPSSGRRRGLRVFLAGLMLGLASMIKLNELMIAFVFLVFLAITEFADWFRTSPRKSPVSAIVPLLLFCLGVVIPALCFLLLFEVAGVLPQFLEANFSFNLRYISFDHRAVVDIRERILEQVLIQQSVLWLTLILGTLTGGLKQFRKSSPGRILVFLWCISSILVIMSTGRYYRHYFFELLTPLACLGSLAVGWVELKRPRLGSRVAVFLILAALVFGGWRFTNLEKACRQPDPYQRVARIIRDTTPEDDPIFVANARPVIYLLADRRVPTPYAMPQWYTEEAYRRALGISLEEFVDHVLGEHPSVIIFRVRPFRLHDQQLLRLLYERIEGSYRYCSVISGYDLWYRKDLLEASSTSEKPGDHL